MHSLQISTSFWVTHTHTTHHIYTHHTPHTHTHHTHTPHTHTTHTHTHTPHTRARTRTPYTFDAMEMYACMSYEIIRFDWLMSTGCAICCSPNARFEPRPVRWHLHSLSPKYCGFLLFVTFHQWSELKHFCTTLWLQEQADKDWKPQSTGTHFFQHRGNCG